MCGSRHPTQHHYPYGSGSIEFAAKAAASAIMSSGGMFCIEGGMVGRWPLGAAVSPSHAGAVATGQQAPVFLTLDAALARPSSASRQHLSISQHACSTACRAGVFFFFAARCPLLCDRIADLIALCLICALYFCALCCFCSRDTAMAAQSIGLGIRVGGTSHQVTAPC